MGRFSRASAMGLLVGTLAVPLPVAAEDTVVSELAVKGRIRRVVPVDLDGDSLKDLLVFTAEGRGAQATRRALVFWHLGERRLETSPGMVWDLDRGITAIDPYPGELPTTDGVPLYSLQSDGIHRHRFDRANKKVESKRVIDASLRHLLPPDDSVTVVDFADSWSGEGLEFLVPDFPHFRLIHPVAESETSNLVLTVDPVAHYWTASSGQGSSANLWVSYSFPVPVTADQSGDGKNEIVFVERNRVTVFDTSVAIGETGHKRVFGVRALSEAETAATDLQIQERLVDLDGDGRLDLVVVSFRETGVLELEGRVQIFRARHDGSFAPDPDQVFSVDDGLYWWMEILDLDGDGRREFVVPAAKIGVWGYVRIVLSRKVSFSLKTVRSGRDGKYDTAGIRSDSFTAKLSQDRDLPVIRPADMTGDGVVDLILGSGDRQVCVHEGSRAPDERRFASRTKACATADPFGQVQHEDLDGDGKQELVHFSLNGENAGKIFVTSMGDL